MILTSLLSKYITKGGRFFSIGCGFVCGYPLGAKTAADLYRRNAISKEEMQLIAGFCNLSSPMFLIGYAKLGIIVCVIYVTALFFLLLGYAYLSWKGKLLDCTSITTENHTLQFEDSAFACCKILLSIGIYMVLFSIISALIKEIPILPSNLKQFLIATMEITTGTTSMMQTGNLALTAGTCVFGGLCGVAQTVSVMKDCPFSTTKYLVCKIIHSITVIKIIEAVAKFF
jgi:hypothetical protein